MSRLGQPNQGGFTLLETLLVIAIAGIVATMGFGYMLSAKPRADLEHAEVIVSSMLTEARNLAISEEINTRVQFDLDTDSMWVESLDRDTGLWSTAVPATQLPDKIHFDTDGITFPSGIVEYTTRGTLMAGGSITFTAEQTGESSTMQGNLATGRFELTGGHLR